MNESSYQQRPTKRAPDAGDSAPFSSSFLRLVIFLAGRLRRPRPSAGNASRYVAADAASLKIATNRVSLRHNLWLQPTFS